MAAITLYDFTVVPFIRSMKNLLHCMEKAEQHAKEKGENIEDYVQLQLIADMKGFGYQIQRLSDSAKFVLSRIGGADPVSMEDNEKTWSEFKARLQKTIDLLEKADRSIFDGKETTEVNMLNGKFVFTGVTYAQRFAIPNFYFHVVTAYDLLRMKGVPVGKMDYLQPEPST